MHVTTVCAYGVMDSTMVFGTISSGSNPDRRTKKKQTVYIKLNKKKGNDIITALRRKI